MYAQNANIRKVVVSKKREKITPTPAEETAEEVSQPLSVPVQIFFHAAGINIEKTETPAGRITELSLLSPTGLAVTVRMNDQSVLGLVEELTGGIQVAKPQIIVP